MQAPGASKTLACILLLLIGRGKDNQKIRIMEKSKIFADILSVLSRVSCIPEDAILSRSREEEVIDVRFILVKLLHERGFYPRSISSLIGRGKTDVCYILRRFDERMECRKMMRHIYFTSVQFLKNK